MVSPKPVETPDAAPVKKSRKKKGYPGETVADRLLEYARRLEQMRLSHNPDDKTGATEATKISTSSQPVNTDSATKPKTKMDKLQKPTHEIDDLSALEWETSSEQSAH